MTFKEKLRKYDELRESIRTLDDQISDYTIIFNPNIKECLIHDIVIGYRDGNGKYNNMTIALNKELKTVFRNTIKKYIDAKKEQIEKIELVIQKMEREE